MRKLASEISSGDKENREAQAARIYWQSLLGDNFRRIPRGAGLNRVLDFGYGILRSAMLRAIAGSGVNPSLGLAHISRRNPFCLADDLMEPYRPIVDIVAYRLNANGDLELGQKEKRTLSILPAIPLATSQGSTSQLPWYYGSDATYCNTSESGVGPQRSIRLTYSLLPRSYRGMLPRNA